jgi:hypothetical protein
LSLEITDLSKTYPNGVKALKDLTLTIGNHMFGLLGPNGAGKSTLMRTVATLQDPDSGTVQLDDLNVLTQKDEVRKVLGKILLNGPYANIYNDIGISFFGLIVIAAIFGTSILRDFQRDTIQILFTKPISKFAYLGGRWAGSFVATIFAFSGLLFGEFFGTVAPWADHSRIGPNHLSWYLQPFFSIVVFQIFFLGSLFFLVAALSLPLSLSQDLHRLPAGRGNLHALHYRRQCLWRHAFARALLVRHPRPRRLSLQ